MYLCRALQNLYAASSTILYALKQGKVLVKEGLELLYCEYGIGDF